MTDIFYYIGIPYIVWEIFSLIITIRDKEDKQDKKYMEDLTSGLPDKIQEADMENVSKTIGALKEFTMKKLFVFITGVFFLVWLIAGYLYAPESNIFLFILILMLVMIIVPVIAITAPIFRSGDIKSVTLRLKEHDAKNKRITMLYCIDSLMKIGAICYLLYTHFLSII